MGKFKVGDKVRIRKDLEDNKMYGGLHWWYDMRQFKGMEGVVVGMTDRGNYMLRGMNFLWSEEMLEPIQEEFTFQEVIARIKPNETYVNTDKIWALESIYMNPGGTLEIKYALSGLNFDIIPISKDLKFKLLEPKKKYILYYIEHVPGGELYKFRSNVTPCIESFVICDTKNGKSYGRVVNQELVNLTEKEYMKYKECYEA